MLDKLKALLAPIDGKRRMTEFNPHPAVAVAALLLEASEVDQAAPQEELDVVYSLLKERFGLDDGALEALLTTTRLERREAGDLWPFTHFIRRTYSPEQKYDLLIMVWQVILADRRLDPYEDQWARRLPEMLAVNASLNIDAKLKARALAADADAGLAAPDGSTGPSTPGGGESEG
jgi:uncharacterized tellurite resistance protein B-like protein